MEEVEVEKKGGGRKLNNKIIRNRMSVMCVVTTFAATLPTLPFLRQWTITERTTETTKKKDKEEQRISFF